MNLTRRQKVGVGLIMVPLIAAIAIQVGTDDLYHVTTTEEPPVGGPTFSTQVIYHVVTLTWRYAAPLVVCAALGLFCLLVPNRTKPNT